MMNMFASAWTLRPQPTGPAVAGNQNNRLFFSKVVEKGRETRMFCHGKQVPADTMCH